MSAILDVDLLEFESGSAQTRRHIVAQTMHSLKSGGFVYTAHDLPRSLLDDTYDLLERFFAQNQEEKESCSDPASHGARGYTGILVETAAISDTPDWKEMFNWSQDIPSAHPLATRYPQWYRPSIFSDDPNFADMRDLLSEFHGRMMNLQRRFLRIIATGLGVAEDYFDSMTHYAPHLSRAIHYPAMSEAPKDTEYVWADEHGDINLITALPRATARGLQIKLDGKWIDAAPPDDHVIINTGIMLQHLTNGIIPTGWHRVIADPSQTEDRISIVQFLHPRPSTILMPLQSTITPENPCRYEAVSADDRLAEVLWEINLVSDTEN